jgi:outer membrane protein TolC
MSRVVWALVGILAVAGRAPATEAGAETPPRAVPLPTVAMRLIDEGKSLPIDLPTALALAAAKNLDIQEAQARVAEARGIRNEAIGRAFPEYTGTFTARRIDGRIQASFGELEDHAFSTILPAGAVELTVNPARALFDGLAAHRSLGAAEDEGEHVRQVVLAATARGYYELQEAQAGVKIAEDALAAARALVRIAHDRAESGTGLTVDVLRAEARAAADDVRLAEARRRLREASVRLALAVKIDPSVTLFPADTVVRQRTLVDARLPLEALTQQARAARPDLAAKGGVLAAAEDGRRATWAGAFGPTVYGSFEESAIGRSLGDLGERQIYGGYVGFRLSHASIGRIQAARARVEQARRQAERLADEVAASVIGAREAALTAEEQIGAADRGLAAAERAHELSEVRFRGGVGIGLEVLDAEAALADARTALVAAIVAYDVAHVALLQAIGGVTVAALQAEPSAPPVPPAR